MIQHSSKYAQEAELVMRELPEDTKPYAELDVARAELHEAEQALVEAYGTWREGMRLAAEAGNARAERYLRRSTWDLT